MKFSLLKTAAAIIALSFATACATDYDNNPPGPRGGPGTNWENPPGPLAAPARRRIIGHKRTGAMSIRTASYGSGTRTMDAGSATPIKIRPDGAAVAARIGKTRPARSAVPALRPIAGFAANALNLGQRVLADDGDPFPHAPSGDDALRHVGIGLRESLGDGRRFGLEQQQAEGRFVVGNRPAQLQLIARRRRARLLQMHRPMRRAPFEIIRRVGVEEEEVFHGNRHVMRCQ